MHGAETLMRGADEALEIAGRSCIGGAGEGAAAGSGIDTVCDAFNTLCISRGNHHIRAKLRIGAGDVFADIRGPRR